MVSSAAEVRVDQIHLRRVLKEMNLSHRVREIEPLARPTVTVRRTKAGPGELSPGGSRIGGLPDLPPGVAWPSWRDQPLAFLAQIDLSELSELPVARVLPDSGLLSFFYHADQETWGFDPEDLGSWRVLWHDGPRSDLEPAPVPEDLPRNGRFSSCPVEFCSGTSAPPVDAIPVVEMGLDEWEWDAYADFLEALQGEDPCHRLLGHPAAIQGDMQVECQLVSHGIGTGDPTAYDDPRAETLVDEADEWRLLFQLDSDDDAGMMWGDCGRLYFWMRGGDLEARRFERAWMILQCY